MDNMRKNTVIEYAEFVNRVMIDTDLSQEDIKIGLCLLHELLTEIKQTDDIKLD
ncbi:hypothetical protein RHO14_06930 [Orbus wheelerorum]|uniref:hypothetical protein n=1 Tax=Orbus wheelerorum TaxID=3074111 RepID=UPI00370D80F3